eukprot:9346508-Pyramimonas_sp.AAC.1
MLSSADSDNPLVRLRYPAITASASSCPHLGYYAQSNLVADLTYELAHRLESEPRATVIFASARCIDAFPRGCWFAVGTSITSGPALLVRMQSSVFESESEIEDRSHIFLLHVSEYAYAHSSESTLSLQCAKAGETPRDAPSGRDQTSRNRHYV